MSNTLMSGGFGKVPANEVDCRRKKIGTEMPEELPKEFGEWMLAWTRKAQANLTPDYYIKLAHISFGYEGKHYELLPESLKVDHARFELIYTDILHDLEELGCEYGVYLGYMD